MTEQSEQELRPIGKGWPGLRSNIGRLVRLPGEMSKCRNVEIDIPDTLSKRRGLVRGIEEYFDVPICGLFSYTDMCQNEWLLISTANGIAVRQPLSLPIFQVADCYPFDDFGGEPADGDPPNADKWKNVSAHLETRSATLGLKASARAVAPGDLAALDYSMSWFKASCGSSYQVEIDVDLPSPASGFVPRAWVIIRAAEAGFQSGAALIGEVGRTDEGVFARLLHLNESRVLAPVAQIGPVTDGHLLFRVAYDSTPEEGGRTATIEMTPDTGSAVSATAQFDSLQDATFGLATGLALFFTSTTPGGLRPALFAAPAFAIDLVDAGSV